MNTEECIVISDEEDEKPIIVGTTSNDEPSGVCMPEFVSVPSTSSINMESETEYVKNPAKVASTEPCNFMEVTKSDLKKSIRKNDLIIKIDGTLNPSNVNAIMEVIKMYNFQNAGKFFFVKSSNPNEEIDVNDLICHEKVLDVTPPDQENCIPAHSQKLNVICKSNTVKALTVVNPNPPFQAVTATTTRKNHERGKRKIDISNEIDQNKRNKFIKVKRIDEIGKASNENSETIVQHVDNNHTNQNQININKLNQFHQNKQNIYNRIRVKPFDQIGITSRQNIGENCDQMGSHQIIDTPFGHNDHNDQNQITINESTEFHQNTQKDCYKIRLKPFSEISKPSHQVVETAVSTDDVQNDLSLQEPRQLQIEKFSQENEHDLDLSLLKAYKNKYCTINFWNNNNTECNKKDDLVCPPYSTNLNVFSVNTQNNPINYEPIQQNSPISNKFSSVSNYDDRLKTDKRKEKTQTKDKDKEPKSRMKNNLQSFYEKKYNLKEVRIALSKLEVENYFAKKRLKKQKTLPKVNKIFIHNHNFESMTRYYCNEIPPNTELYFVNKHNITTSLYMKSFPLFEKAIKTNKIKIINESTYKKYQLTQEDKVMSLSNSSITKRETQKFCKFVSDFHHSLGSKQNPFLKYIKLDHSYSFTGY